MKSAKVALFSALVLLAGAAQAAPPKSGSQRAAVIVHVQQPAEGDTAGTTGSAAVKPKPGFPTAPVIGGLLGVTATTVALTSGGGNDASPQ